MQYSLGPLLYCWQKNKVIDFYNQVAESVIPLVYLGEVVCSRRRELTNKDYLSLAYMLKEAGKNVVLSTMALVENQSELTEMKKLIENGDFTIEANDMAGVELARENKLPFVSGADINHYNLASLKLLHKYGMIRFVMPVELSKEWLQQVVGDRAQLGFEVEVIGHGYVPLAHSARCFTARHLGLAKDKCDTACLEHEKGFLLQTQDSQSLLRINGIQTQSASLINLQDQVEEMSIMGVDYFRVLPNGFSSIELAENLVLTKQNIKTNIDENLSNGYWYGEAGIVNYSQQK